MRDSTCLRSARGWLIAFAIGAAAGGLSRCAAEEPGAACATCHPNVTLEQASAHSGVKCAACHPGRTTVPHPKKAAAAACGTCHAAVSGDHAASIHGQARKRLVYAPSCDACHGKAHAVRQARSADFRKRVPEVCGGCHKPIAVEYAASVHGKGLAAGALESAVCTDCHGEHSIQAAASGGSTVSASRIADTCGRCHGNVRLAKKFGIPSDRVLSFNATFHGLTGRKGSQTVANCASCHGAHNILPSSDPKSTINAKNLAATCSKCHPGAGTRYALGPVHILPGRVEPAAVRGVRLAYTFLIPVVLGLVLLHNGSDWARKFRRLRDRRREGAVVETRWSGLRMARFERVLHATVVVAFAVLAWTGFDLVYPEQWWARPIDALAHNAPVRGVIHRIAAVIFIGAALLHVFSLARPASRAQWRRLWLSWSDFKTALESLAHNLGLKRAAPPRAEYGFIERFTYWPAAWSALLMIASGLLLWSHRFALAWVPKQVLDAAAALHFYEAVLACLAVVTWHLYHVMFDPAVYPMDTTWIIGRNLRETAEPAQTAVHAGQC